jgi:hypothetical protein
MDDLLAGLSKQQAMLLLTAVAFGGQESMRALEHLPEDQEQLLRERARRILQIPRERRVPYLVQEIKRLVASKRTDGLGGASAAHVAAALQGERPSVIEALLRALPAELAKDARLALRHPGVKLSRELRPALLAALRWRFEEKLARTPPPPNLTMDDLPRLKRADMAALCDALGARFLAQGLAAAGGSERAERLAQLSPAQRVAAERPGSGAPRMDRELARRWVDGLFSAPDPQGAVRDLGLRRLARACNAVSTSLAREVAEAHPGDIGAALVRLAEEERAKPQAGADACRREVLSELQVLAARGAGASDRPEACAPAAQRTRITAGPRRPNP